MAIHSTRVRALLTAGVLTTILGTGIIGGAAFPAIAETLPSPTPTDTATPEPSIAPTSAQLDDPAPQVSFDPCPDLLNVMVTDITDTSFVLHWTVDTSADYTSFEVFLPRWVTIPADGSSSYDLPFDGLTPGSYIDLQMAANCTTHPHPGGGHISFDLTGGDGKGGFSASMAGGVANSSASAVGAETGNGEPNSSASAVGAETGNGEPNSSVSAVAAETGDGAGDEGSASSATSGSETLNGAAEASQSIPQTTSDNVDPAVSSITPAAASLAETGSQGNPIMVASGLLLITAGGAFVLLTTRARARARG